MKRLWRGIGIVTFWLVLPALAVYVRGSRRSRVLVRSGSKILVVKMWLGSGEWILPGGGIHAGEAERAAAVREVREETGVQLAESRLQVLGAEPYRARGLHYNAFYYQVSVADALLPKPQLFEIVDAAWLDIAELHASNIGADVAAALRLAGLQNSSA